MPDPLPRLASMPGTAPAAIVNLGAQAVSDTTPTPYADISLWDRSRISSFMHETFTRHGRNRKYLKKAAEDCAGWYHVETESVVRVWVDVYPLDLRMDNYVNPERIER